MPRSRGGGGGRPAARPPTAPSRPNMGAPAPPNPQQQRSASTAAMPPQAQQQGQGQQGRQGPGLFGQMASTAAGVAVGSSIGHAIGGFFGGGQSAEQQQQQQPMDQYQQNASGYGAQEPAGPCAMDIKNFTNCMNEHQGNMSICGWYMEQLKACQQAAGRY